MTPNSSPAEPAQANEDCRRRQVLAAQVRLLYGNANVGVGVTLVATSILGYLQWEVVAHPIVLSWCLYMFLVAAGRFTLASRYWRGRASRRGGGVPGSLWAPAWLELGGVPQVFCCT